MDDAFESVMDDDEELDEAADEEVNKVLEELTSGLIGTSARRQQVDIPSPFFFFLAFL